MIIRRATPADEAAMRALWAELDADAAYTPYPGAGFSTTLLTDQIALLAEEAGQPIGSVYAATPSEHYGFVFGLDGGRQHIVLNVDTPNMAARALYDDLGFVDAARTLRIEIDQLLGR